jgi:hypothetical protein
MPLAHPVAVPRPSAKAFEALRAHQRKVVVLLRRLDANSPCAAGALTLAEFDALFGAALECFSSERQVPREADGSNLFSYPFAFSFFPS